MMIFILLFSFLYLTLPFIFKDKIGINFISAIHCYGCLILYYTGMVSIEDMFRWSIAYFFTDSIRCLYKLDFLFLFHHIVAIMFACFILNQYSIEATYNASILHKVYIQTEYSNILMYPVYCLLHSKWSKTRLTKILQIFHFINYSYYRITILNLENAVVSLSYGADPIILMTYGVYLMGVVWSVKLLLQLSDPY